MELNHESLFLIFSSLDDARSLARAAAVCRSWCRAARDDRLWMWLFMRAVPAMPRPVAMPASWRLAMLERLRVAANWARRRFTAARLAGHRCLSVLRTHALIFRRHMERGAGSVAAAADGKPQPPLLAAQIGSQPRRPPPLRAHFCVLARARAQVPACARARVC